MITSQMLKYEKQNTQTAQFSITVFWTGPHFHLGVLGIKSFPLFGLSLTSFALRQENTRRHSAKKKSHSHRTLNAKGSSFLSRLILSSQILLNVSTFLHFERLSMMCLCVALHFGYLALQSLFLLPRARDVAWRCRTGSSGSLPPDSM